MQVLLTIFNLSGISDEKTSGAAKFVSMQEFILLADFISPPQLLYLIDNGFFHHFKTEDELSKSIQTPGIKDYTLLKSLTKLKVELHNG